MAVTGLTSQEAQQKLHNEITAFAARDMKESWLHGLVHSPYTSLSSVLILAVGFLLLIDFIVGERRGIVLFQSILVLLLASLNLVHLSWEMYVLKTRRIRQLLEKVKPFLGSFCPWVPQSYPATPIATLRGNLTVRGYRDGVLVNIPTSLLVEGDVIQLHRRMPTPARVTLLSSSGVLTETCFHANEVPPTELFDDEGVYKEPNVIRFTQESEPLEFVVSETPIMSILQSTIGKTVSDTLLSREKNSATAVLCILVGVTFVFSLTVNLIRYFALTEDFDGVWPELMLQLQSYTVLPLLLLPLPRLWTVMNVYGTVRIILLVEKGPSILQVRGIGKRLKLSGQTILLMLKVLLRPSRYPNHRAFHILGTLTSLCAVDKEYVLTGSYPTPEKVFFLRCTKPTGECSSQNEDIMKEDEEGERNSDSEDNLIKSTDGQIAFEIESPSPTGSSDDKAGFSSPVLSGKCSSVDSEHLGTTLEVIYEEAEKDSKESVHSKPLDIASAVSTISDAAPVEVITEILDMSPNPESISGLCFDDIDWEVHIDSLKPVGVNVLITSHLLNDPYLWYPSGTSEALRRYLHSTKCSYLLGVEIGVTEYSTSQFDREVLLYSVSNPPISPQSNTLQSRKATLFNSVQGIQPHIISTVLHDHASESYLVMSRGSGSMIASCCSDFWDGKDLQPMTELERGTILDFFTRRNLTSYCIALAYNPLLEFSLSPLKEQKIGIYVPESYMRKNFSDVSMMVSTRSPDGSLPSADQVFSTLQCNQVFLGMVSLQFQPKRDIVSLIEDLEVAGIRFVHFTAEDKVRGKIFAEKLGLEAGWNCHISLAPAQDEDDVSSESEEEFGSSVSSSTSSLSSVINAFQSYIRAKLPRGIYNIRPHIKNVDNVPLLVPLFTDCTSETIQEMIEIMQENGEVVMCIGNAWNRDNISIFSQADISLSVIPEDGDAPKYPGKMLHSFPSSLSDPHRESPAPDHIWPNPLEMATYLNSATCQISVHRDCDVSILSLVTESRHIVNCIRRGLLFGLGSFLALTILMLLGTVLFLPPPLSGSHLFWFVLLVVPSITLSFLASPLDPAIKSQMPNRKKQVWGEKRLFLFNFSLTFLPTAGVCFLLFAATLAKICMDDIPHSDCHPLLGDRNRTNSSQWNGWRGENEQGLLFAQDVTAFFTALYLIVLSIRFIHRTVPIWKLWKFTPWQFITLTGSIVTFQIIYFLISQSVAIGSRGLTQITSPPSVPIYVWIVGFAWPFLLVPVQEVLKYQDKMTFVETQRHLRLEFETKLGMNSPF